MSINWEGQVVTCTVRELSESSAPVEEILNRDQVNAESVRVVYEESIRIGTKHGYDFKQLVVIPHSPVFAVFVKSDSRSDAQ